MSRLAHTFLLLVCVVGICFAQQAPTKLTVEGYGDIVVPAGVEPFEEVEKFSQQLRLQGTKFTPSQLQSFMDYLCGETKCTRKLQELSLELKGIGTIVVDIGQSPHIAIDEFLVRASSAGHTVNDEGVTQVLDYFCTRKPCLSSALAPIDLVVGDIGTLTVSVGQEVADAVESFATRARDAGHAITLDDVSAITSNLCARKTCNRAVSLPPYTLDINGVGQVAVTFGEEPAYALERFVVGLKTKKGPTLTDENIDMIMDSLCTALPCRSRVSRVSLEITNVGTLKVDIGQEPASAVRQFIDGALRDGVALTNEDAANIMKSTCELKRCTNPLDLEPLSLQVGNIGTVSLPIGSEPADVFLRFVEQARAAGTSIGAQDATVVMERLCGMTPCRKVLNLNPATLNVTGVGTIEVPFGAEPADVVTSWLEEARAAGYTIDGGLVAEIMDRLCAVTPCFKNVDTSPYELNVTGVGTVAVPFGVEPADSAERFFLSARKAGVMIGAETATQIMNALCQARTCNRLLDLSPLTINISPLNISGYTEFVLEFGQEPAKGLAQFVDGVVASGGSVTGDEATSILKAICDRIACFVPLDVNPPVTLTVENVGSLVVPFGVDPTKAILDWVESVIAAGSDLIGADTATKIYENVCSRVRCYRPLDVTPYQLELANIGTLTVPFGAEPVKAVNRFLLDARAAGQAVGAEGADQIFELVCASRRCHLPIDTSPVVVNVTAFGFGEGFDTLSIPFGDEPADVLRAFISRTLRAGYTVTYDDSRAMMQSACAAVACLKALDLSPITLEVASYGTVVVPIEMKPRDAVVAFGNTHSLTMPVLQQILTAVCARMKCADYE